MNETTNRAGLSLHLEIMNNNKGVIFSSDEMHHKVHRKLMLTNLMKPSYQKQIAEMINELTDKFTTLTFKKLVDNKCEIDMSDQLIALTLDVIGRAVLSLDLKAIEGSQSQFQHVSREINELFPQLGRLPRWYFCSTFLFHINIKK